MKNTKRSSHTNACKAPFAPQRATGTTELERPGLKRKQQPANPLPQPDQPSARGGGAQAELAPPRPAPPHPLARAAAPSDWPISFLRAEIRLTHWPGHTPINFASPPPHFAAPVRKRTPGSVRGAAGCSRPGPARSHLAVPDLPSPAGTGRVERATPTSLTFFTSKRFLPAPLLVPLGVSTSIAAAILDA